MNFAYEENGLINVKILLKHVDMYNKVINCVLK